MTVPCVLAIALSVLLVDAGAFAAESPSWPKPDPALAAERLAVVRQHDLSSARIFVGYQRRNGGEIFYDLAELTGSRRTKFLAILERADSYYDMPGVIGCVGPEYVIAFVWRGRVTESWFSAKCQRIIPVPGTSGPGIDVPLSARGARGLAAVIRGVHRR